MFLRTRQSPVSPGASRHPFGQIVHLAGVFILLVGRQQSVKSVESGETARLERFFGPAVALHFMLFVLVVVAIDAKQFPVRAVGRVVFVVSVLVMDRQQMAVLPFELPAAFRADEPVNPQ